MTKYEKLKTTILAIFTIGFLLCLYCYSENGKFSYSSGRIIDTRTGDVYFLKNQQKLSLEKFEPFKKNE
jgi:hypothetical protein